MNNEDFTITLVTDQATTTVFNAINNVYGWWSEDFKGSSDKLQDEFEVNFGDMHRSTQKLVELVPGKKVVWQVLDSNLSFLTNKSIWTGTKIIFDISVHDNKTQLRLTHQGLVPEIECFKDCSKGWNYYIRQSLLPLINTGIGKSNKQLILTHQ